MSNLNMNLKMNLNKSHNILVLLLVLSLTICASLSVSGCKPAAPTTGEPKLHTPSSSELEKWNPHKERLLTLHSYDAYGKVAYKSNKGGGNANVHWEQRGNKYLIELGGALGAGIRITGQPNFVSLMKPTGELAVAKTEEELLAKTLGFNIPIRGMSSWLKGIPAPHNTPTKMMFDQNHNLALLEQDGWTIKYENYSETNGIHMPANITMDNNPIKLKVVVNRWAFTAPKVFTSNDSNRSASSSNSSDVSNSSSSSSSTTSGSSSSLNTNSFDTGTGGSSTKKSNTSKNSGSSSDSAASKANKTSFSNMTEPPK